MSNIPLIGVGELERRALGSEVEYGVICSELKGVTHSRINFSDPGAIALQLYVNNPYSLNKILKNTEFAGLDIMINGGRFYVDGVHPESCTPPVTLPSEFVRYEFAGMLATHSALRRFYDGVLSGLVEETPTQLALVKNNRSYNYGGSFGYHLNLQTRREQEHYEWNPMLAFLVSSPVLFGAGEVHEHRYSSGFGFHLAAKLPTHQEVMNYETTEPARGIISLRDEPHASSTFRRLHITPLDNGVTPGAIWLKAAVTSLIATIEEAGLVDRAASIVPVDPVGAAWRFSTDHTMSHLAEVDDRRGSKMTALDMQEALHSLVGEAIGSVDVHPEYLEAYRIWGELIQTFKSEVVNEARTGDLNQLVEATSGFHNIIDWTGKLAMIVQSQRTDFIAARSISTMRHYMPLANKKGLIETGDILKRFLRMGDPVHDQVHALPFDISIDHIYDAVLSPPPYRSAALVAEARRMDQEPGVKILHIDWSRIMYQECDDTGRTISRVKFVDPRTSEIIIETDDSL